MSGLHVVSATCHDVFSQSSHWLSHVSRIVTVAIVYQESLLRTESGGSAPRQACSTSGEGGHGESQELDNGVVVKSSSIDVGESMVNGIGARKVQDTKNRWSKPVAKRLKVQKIEDLDEKEECSRTDGKDFHDEENGDALDTEETKLTQSQRKKRVLTQRGKKRSRQLFAGGTV